MYLAIALLFARTTQRPRNTHWQGGRVQLRRQLRRDLEWWRTVPNQNNGRSIYKPIETACLHADSSDYGWGVFLNSDANYQARGFKSATDILHHITWKELQAVRHTDTQSNRFSPSSKAGASYYTRTTRQWSPRSHSLPPGHQF
jgi:hypothetical protein